MRFVQDDDVIEAVATNRSDQPFDVRILPGRSCRGDDFFDAHVPDAIVKYAAIGSVAITDHEPWSVVVRERLDDLLRRPLRRGMCGGVEADDHAPIVAKDDEREEDAECCCRHCEEVDCYDVRNVVIEERSRCLRRGRSPTSPDA